MQNWLISKEPAQLKSPFDITENKDILQAARFQSQQTQRQFRHKYN